MIKEFKDNYRWLSNMFPFKKPYVYEGISYRTNEHFYVAMKTIDLEIRKQISEIQSPGKVKRFGRTIAIRKDWADIKLDVMYQGLKYKFSKPNPILRAQLLATGTEHIQEGNTWEDMFWGVCLYENIGRNHLGILLMKVREEVQLEEHR